MFAKRRDDESYFEIDLPGEELKRVCRQVFDDIVQCQEPARKATKENGTDIAHYIQPPPALSAPVKIGLLNIISC